MKNSTKSLLIKLFAFAVTAILVFALSVTAFAADETTAQAAQETSSSSANGLGLIAAAIVTGLAGIGGGIAIAAAAPAAIAATSEDSKAFGKALIFVALGESIVLFGFVVSILILNNV